MNLSKRLSIAAAAVLVLTAGPARAAGEVTVLYAGSLVNLMEHDVGPAFEQRTGLRFVGYAAGSKQLANEIKGRLRKGDVFISASPAVNESLRGAANGDWSSWYVTFGRSPLGLGYRADSRFARRLRTERFDRVLCGSGIRVGRTDPKLDPKGVLTVEVASRAETLYKHPGLAQCMLGEPGNPAQVLPEETLLGRLQSGQLDAGFFYSVETAAAHLPFTPLPAELAAGAKYTVTVLERAPHPDAAARFAAFLLSPEGRALLAQRGIRTDAPTLAGDAATVPAPVRAVLGKGQ